MVDVEVSKPSAEANFEATVDYVCNRGKDGRRKWKEELEELLEILVVELENSFDVANACLQSCSDFHETMRFQQSQYRLTLVERNALVAEFAPLEGRDVGRSLLVDQLEPSRDTMEREFRFPALQLDYVTGLRLIGDCLPPVRR
jgi:hypothetical protein